MGVNKGLLTFSTIALLAGCSGNIPSSPSDTDTKTDADADADTDTDTDTDTDADTDSDADADIGLVVREGTATVTSESYTGTEDWLFTGDSGDGDLLCQISTALVSVAPRTDCPVCLWAFDLEVTSAEVLVDEGGLCMTIFGVDAASAGSWVGLTRTYGYNPDYFGHAQVMMIPSEQGTGEWQAVDYVSYDAKTETLQYEWVDGEQTY